MKKALSWAMLLLLFIGMLTLIVKVKPAKTETKTIIVPDDYPTIKEAINATSPGDTIFVKAGTYFENLIIAKSITLMGEDSSKTVIDGSGEIVVYVASSNVNVTEFTIRNGSCGVYINGVSMGSFIGNIITNNTYGMEIYSSTYITLRRNRFYGNMYNLAFESNIESPIHFIHDIDNSNTVDGKPVYYLINQRNMEIPSDAGFVALINSSRVLVKDLDLRNNGIGVLLLYTNDSIVQNVNITNMAFSGILLLYSSNNTIIGNRLNSTSWGIYLSSETNNNEIIGNIVANSSFGILLHGPNSKRNLINGNFLTKNSKGIHLGGWTYRNTMTGNTIVNNTIGLSMDFNSGNLWNRNTIAHNGLGIYLWGTQRNYIYHNNFILNNKRGFLKDSKDYWDNGYPSGGNYWSDYKERYPAAKELDGSGLWDTPYIIDDYNQDTYPLMYPYDTQTYKLIVAKTEGGTTTPPPGVYTYTDGTIVLVTAIPDANYRFKYWILDGANVSSTNPIEVLIDHNYTLEAHFIEGIPPITTDDYDGLWRKSDFTITLTAVDYESNVAETYYRINNGSVKRVSVDGQPLITAESDNNNLEYWSIDNAGNEEIPHKFLTGIKLDKTAPVVIEVKRELENNVKLNQPVKVLVNATDTLSGIKNVTLSYCISESLSWTDVPLNLNTTSGLYEGTIQISQENVMVKYKITVYDNAGNYIVEDNAGQYYSFLVIPSEPIPLWLIGTLTAIFAIILVAVGVIFRKRKIRK